MVLFWCLVFSIGLVAFDGRGFRFGDCGLGGWCLVVCFWVGFGFVAYCDALAVLISLGLVGVLLV